jgi:tetratricopeptide (TPR) repeat protein
MTRLLRALALFSSVLFAISAFAQNAVCGAHPQDPAATIAACTPVIKQAQHHTASCEQQAIWAASTRLSDPLATTPSLPLDMSPECSSYLPPQVLYRNSARAIRLAESHYTPSSAAGTDLSAQPVLDDALLLRAEAYFTTRKFSAAVKDFNAAAKIEPLGAKLLYHRALSYHGLNNDNRAVNDFSASLKLTTSDPAIWADSCRSRAILGNLPQALSDCNTSVQLQRNYAAAYKARGLVYLKSSQFALARDNFDDAIKLSKPTAVSLYGRGLAKRASGDPTGAAADTSAALQLNPAVPAIFKRYRVRLK